MLLWHEFRLDFGDISPRKSYGCLSDVSFLPTPVPDSEEPFYLELDWLLDFSYLPSACIWALMGPGSASWLWNCVGFFSASLLCPGSRTRSRMRKGSKESA